MKSFWFAASCLAAGCGHDDNAAQDAPPPSQPDAPPDVPIDAAIDTPPDAPPDAAFTSADAGANTSLLSMQGVYGDFTGRVIPTDAFPYTVRWELWADGATKRRWVIFPPGAGPIDNTNPEHWRFPAGTRFVKEFSVGGTLVETRIIETLPSGSPAMRTYVWRADQTDADLDDNGASNVAGTPHDAPSLQDCITCHRSEPGGALAFSAVQLPPAKLQALAAAGRLAAPLPNGAVYGPTGTAEEVAALGYLHGNCGHCHNPNGFASQYNNMTLRLDAASKPVTAEPAYLTAVGVTVQGDGLGATKRVDPGSASTSAIVRRMSVRGTGQMPWIATEVVDPTGVATITTWVNDLAP